MVENKVISCPYCGKNMKPKENGDYVCAYNHPIFILRRKQVAKILNHPVYDKYCEELNSIDRGFVEEKLDYQRQRKSLSIGLFDLTNTKR